MPYLIFGEDTFRSRAKLNAIKSKYIDASLGDTNLAKVDGATARMEEITRQIWAMPFLANKRLVVIENLLTQGNKEVQDAIADFLPKVPSTSVVIFYEEGTPDKRGGLFKKLRQPKQSEEYIPLEGIELRKWIKRRFDSLEAKAEPEVMEYLLKEVGADLWRMEQEIIKLSLYCPEQVTREAVEEMVHMEPSGDVFQCIDALAAQNIPLAIKHLRGRLALGDSPIYLLSMFVYGFRNILIAHDATARGAKVPPKGIHPYVWRKSTMQAKRYSANQLKRIYGLLRDLDYGMKTGIIEPMVALDLFVFELSYGKVKEGADEHLAAHQGIS